MSNTTRGIILSLAVVCGLVASNMPAFAAYDDVSLGTDTVISVGGISLNISGSTAAVASITVNSDTFSAVLDNGSSIKVSSSDRYVVSVDRDETDQSCTNNEFTITAASSDSSGTHTVTFTPTTTTCGRSTSGGSSRRRATTPTPAPVTTPVVTPAPAVPAPGYIFSLTLRLGMEHPDILQLQKFLNTAPDTQVADTGPGSPGNETDYFGPLTERAVEKFQTKHGIVSSGTPGTTGFGLVGPRTRERLQQLSGTPATPATQNPSTLTIAELQAMIDDLLQQIEALTGGQ